MQSEIPKKEDYVPAVSLVDIFFKAKELERRGFDVIHFDAGEPDLIPRKRSLTRRLGRLRRATVDIPNLVVFPRQEKPSPTA